MGFGSIVASLGMGALSSGGSSALGIGTGMINQRQQYGYNKKQRYYGPGWDVSGLRRAGLNPILAAGATGSSPGVAPIGPGSDVSSSAKNLADTFLKNKQRQIAAHTATSAKSQAIIDQRRAMFASKKFDYLNTSNAEKILLPVAAANEAGLSINSAKNAAIVSGVLNATSKSSKSSKTHSSPRPEKGQKRSRGNWRTSSPRPPRDSKVPKFQR